MSFTAGSCPAPAPRPAPPVFARRLLVAASIALVAPATAWAQADAGPAGVAGLAAGPAPAAGEPAVYLGLAVWEWALWSAPFLLASLIALWFGAERLVALRTGRVLPRAFLDRFFNLLDSRRMTREHAEELCEESGSPVATVFHHAARKWGRPAVEVEQAVIDGGERQVARLKKNLRVLNGVATVTPLMGLLGTVLGMIRAFAKLADGGAMGNADQLAAGIVTALLTTAMGLVVAIPSLILYLYLTGRIEGLVVRIDGLAQQVVDAISEEALEDAAARAAAPAPSFATESGDAGRPAPRRRDPPEPAAHRKPARAARD